MSFVIELCPEACFVVEREYLGSIGIITAENIASFCLNRESSRFLINTLPA